MSVYLHNANFEKDRQCKEKSYWFNQSSDVLQKNNLWNGQKSNSFGKMWILLFSNVKFIIEGKIIG